MPRLTQAAIRSARADSDLLKLLFAQLNESAPPSLHEDLDQFVEAVQRLPVGLRAMASTFQLDVSMALDDLGWHFGNWFHEGYNEETSRGLKELEAHEVAEVFDQAYAIALQHWDELDRALDGELEEFVEWYRNSRLLRELEPLNERMWELLKSEEPGAEPGIFRFWVAYARKHPERVAP